MSAVGENNRVAIYDQAAMQSQTQLGKMMQQQINTVAQDLPQVDITVKIAITSFTPTGEKCEDFRALNAQVAVMRLDNSRTEIEQPRFAATIFHYKDRNEEEVGLPNRVAGAAAPKLLQDQDGGQQLVNPEKGAVMPILNERGLLSAQQQQEDDRLGIERVRLISYDAKRDLVRDMNTPGTRFENMSNASKVAGVLDTLFNTNLGGIPIPKGNAEESRIIQMTVMTQDKTTNKIEQLVFTQADNMPSTIWENMTGGEVPNFISLCQSNHPNNVRKRPDGSPISFLDDDGRGGTYWHTVYNMTAQMNTGCAVTKADKAYNKQLNNFNGLKLMAMGKKTPLEIEAMRNRGGQVRQIGGQAQPQPRVKGAGQPLALMDDQDQKADA